MPKKVSDWKEIPDETLAEFENAVNKAMAEILPKDHDGAFPVQVTIVDRRKYEAMHFEPLPYDHDVSTEAELLEIENTAFRNLAIASHAVDFFLKMRENYTRHGKYQHYEMTRWVPDNPIGKKLVVVGHVTGDFEKYTQGIKDADLHFRAVDKYSCKFCKQTQEETK